MHIVTDITDNIITVIDYGPMIKSKYTLSELERLVKTLEHKNKSIIGVAYTKTLGIYELTSYDIETHISESEMQEFLSEDNRINKCSQLFINNTYITLEPHKIVRYYKSK